MEIQIILNWSFGIAIFLAGVVSKVFWDMIISLKDDVKELNEQVHKDFVRRDDFKDAIQEIRRDINTIFAKIEHTVTLIYKKLS